MMRTVLVSALLCLAVAGCYRRQDLPKAPVRHGDATPEEQEVTEEGGVRPEPHPQVTKDPRPE